MFTLVTKKAFKKGTTFYFGFSLFLGFFTYIYEQFSYGESSWYMRGMFLIPLVGALVFLLSVFQKTWLRHRLSYFLFHSALAIFVSGCLIKGIIEISGRSTSLEQLYWGAGVLFLGLSFLSALIGKHAQQTEVSPTYK